MVQELIPFNIGNYVQIPDGRGLNAVGNYAPSCHYDKAHQVSAHGQQYYILVMFLSMDKYRYV